MGTSKKKAPKVNVRDIKLLVTKAEAMLGGVLRIMEEDEQVAATISSKAAGKRFDKGCPPPTQDFVKRFDQGCPAPVRVDPLGTGKGSKERDGIAVGARKRLRHAKVLVDTAFSLLPVVAKSQAMKKKNIWTPANPSGDTNGN